MKAKDKCGEEFEIKEVEVKEESGTKKILVFTDGDVVKTCPKCNNIIYPQDLQITQLDEEKK